MSYTISQLKSDVVTTIGTNTSDQIVGFDDIIIRATRQLLSDIDPEETIRTTVVQVYDGVEGVPAPVDLKSNAIIDFTPQSFGIVVDVPRKTSLRPFRQKINNQYTHFYDNGVAKIKTTQALIQYQTVLSNTETTGVTTGASDLEVFTDYLGNSSLQFTSASSQYIEETYDAVNVKPSGEFFLDFYSTQAQTVNVLIGTDSSNYYSFDFTSNGQGWEQVQILRTPANLTGTITDYTYFKLTTDAGVVRVGRLIYSEGQPFSLVYYSTYLFKDALTGAMKEQFTSESDYLVLDFDACNILTYATAELIAQHLKSQDGQFDVKMFSEKYQKAVKDYIGIHHSQSQPLMSNYYTLT